MVERLQEIDDVDVDNTAENRESDGFEGVHFNAKFLGTMSASV